MEFKNEFYETLQLLDRNDLLQHIILIGSWAEYLYEESNIIDNYVSTTKTLDIDFLIRNIRLPREGVDIFKIFEEEEYITDMSRNGIVVFRKGKFEIEFLARQIGKPTITIKSPSFGIEVETLGHMSMIVDNTIDVKFKNLVVIIPDPVAFIIHKMIINKDRGKKKEKDVVAIKNLIFYMEDNPEYVSKLELVFDKLTKKEKKTVREFISDYNIDFKL